MTATDQTEPTTGQAPSLLPGITTRRGWFTLAADRPAPVVVFAALLTVVAVIGQLAGRHSLTGGGWTLAVALPVVLVVGQSARAYQRIRAGHVVHPVQRVLAAPVLVLTIVVLAFLAVIAVVDPSVLGVK